VRTLRRSELQEVLGLVKMTIKKKVYCLVYNMTCILVCDQAGSLSYRGMASESDENQGIRCVMRPQIVD